MKSFFYFSFHKLVCVNNMFKNDIRLQFINKETKEVLSSIVGLTQRLNSGVDSTPCFACQKPFKNDPFIFIVLKNYMNLDDDTIKFCCLSCCQSGEENMDTIEIYPTLRLHDVKKLMYFRVIKKFIFDFVDSSKLMYKRYDVGEEEGMEGVLRRVFNEKKDNIEIQSLCLMCDNRIVAEDSAQSMRIDYGREYNFEQPLSITANLARAINKHCTIARYSLEVYYKEYNDYSPFVVYYNRDVNVDCTYCANKIVDGYPVFYCSDCGPTNPNYFRYKLILPFWKETYDYKKIYWKVIKKDKKGLGNCNLMLYARRIL
ncbi:ME53 [Diatraea saccharalis granulovirus]|uniref:ME53 n=1 Tax=Diatraea saccharalis granulovirus TaxID=1675862 RepID=A0A0R7EYY1_9BBAC|nr:ME53 [Diatraea saccharalis granulovirus]AKN80765.1 ME53 [Diatraea saccharalis granulovirus]